MKAIRPSLTQQVRGLVWKDWIRFKSTWPVHCLFSLIIPIALTLFVCLVKNFSRSLDPDVTDLTCRRSNAVAIRTITSYFLLLGFSFVGYGIVGTKISERRDRLTLYLNSVGCRSFARLLETYIYYGSIYGIGWIICSVIISVLQFPEHWYLIILTQLLYGLSLIGWSLLVSNFFGNSVALGIFVYMLLLGLAVFPYMTPIDNGIQLALMSIIPSIGFSAAYKIISTSLIDNDYKLLYTFSKDNKSYNIVTVLTIMLAQSILFPIISFFMESYLYKLNSTTKYKAVQDIHCKSDRPQIEIKNLTKNFGKTCAVNDISMELPRNSITCLIGQNGSGKTTAMEIMSGLQHPSKGSIKVEGFETNSSQVPKGTISFCPQKDIFWNNLTVRQNLQFLSSIKVVYDKNYNDIDFLIEQCDLKEKANCRAGSLSGGQKRRLQMALTLLGGPPVVIFDEVTSSLDPISRRKVMNIIINYKSQERTILFATHFLDESDSISDVIAIMHKGEMPIFGNIYQVKQEWSLGYILYMSCPGMENVLQNFNKYNLAICKINTEEAEVVLGSSTTFIIQILNEMEILKQSIKDLDYEIRGPSVNDVFLTFLKNQEKTDLYDYHESSEKAHPELISGQTVKLFWQIPILLRKRILLAKHNWISMILMLLFAISFVIFGASQLPSHKITSCEDFDNSFRNLGFFNQSDFTSEAMCVVIALISLSLYPMFLCLAPIRESRTREIYYANGIHPVALWASHVFFELFTAIIISLIVVLSYVFGSSKLLLNPAGLFFSSLLYCISVTLFVYCLTFKIKSPFVGCALVLIILQFFNIASITTLIIPYTSENDFTSSLNSNITWTSVCAIISPLAPMTRSLAVSLNAFANGCRFDGQHFKDTKNWVEFKFYGMPIFFLIYHIFLWSSILLWLVNGFPLKRKKIQNFCVKSEKQEVDDSVQLENDRILSGTANDNLLITQISKCYSKKTGNVLEDINFGVNRGECFALLGPNGAGKTTLFDIMRGHLKPNTGSVIANAIDIFRDKCEARTHLGFCPQFSYFENMTVKEILNFYASIKGIPKDKILLNTESIIEKVGLKEFRNRSGQKLSGGNQRKLSLAVALIGNPTIMLIDEASTGMDVAAKRLIWKTIKDLRQNHAIVFTTHSMEEADALATRVGIIKKRFLVLGKPNELRKRFCPGYQILIQLNELSAMELDQFIYSKLPGSMKLNHSTSTNCRYSIGKLDGATLIANIFITLEEAKSKFAINHYSVCQGTLEDLFLAVVI